MKERDNDNENYYHLVAETKLYDEQYFVHDDNDISPNR